MCGMQPALRRMGLKAMAKGPHFSEKVRFLFIGGLNTGINYAVLLVLDAFLKEWLSPQEIYVVTAVLVTVPAFILQSRVVFLRRPTLARYVRYCGSTLLSTVCGTATLFVLTDFLAINRYAGYMLSIVAGLVISYLLLKYFVFRRQNAD